MVGIGGSAVAMGLNLIRGDGSPYNQSTSFVES